MVELERRRRRERRNRERLLRARRLRRSKARERAREKLLAFLQFETWLRLRKGIRELRARRRGRREELRRQEILEPPSARSA
jgi:hypothetical protein